MSNNSNNNNNDPWAWAGLLKWSLNYVDGTDTTASSSSAPPMSEEDKAFLETVMREGIVDEGERMKEILSQCSAAMEYYQSVATTSSDDTEKIRNDPPPPIADEHHVEDLLQELRDIVEQIDYARAFCSLQGLPFLLGCVTQTNGVPNTIRMACLGILSTLCQNNPPVQEQFLELGAIKTLSDLFFQEEEKEEEEKEQSSNLKAKTMQAISSIVRSHELAEQVFSQLDQAVSLFLTGLKIESSSLNARTLFFLRTFTTSDTSDEERIQRFGKPIGWVLDHYLLSPLSLSEEDEANQKNLLPSNDLRENSLALLTELLDRKLIGIHFLEESRKTALVSLGIQRISTLRLLTGDEKEFAKEELELWERCLVLLARMDTH